MSSIADAPFYQRFPFNSPVNLKDADIRGAYCPKLNMFYSRIPKAANTTIMFTLATARDGHEPGNLLIKKSFRRPSDMTKDQVVRLVIDCFVFTFVRNPYSRLLSTYLSQVVPGHIPAPQPFTEFIEFIADGRLYSNPHWAPQTSLFLVPLDVFKFIGRYEHFNMDMMVVAANIGQPSLKPVTGYAVMPTYADKRIEHWYDLKMRERVYQLYRPDFEELGYDATR